MRPSRWFVLAAFGLLALLPGPSLVEGRHDDDDEGESDDMDIDEEALSPRQLAELHKKFDRDQDGKVSMAEVLAYSELVAKEMAHKDISAILDELDTSKDGKLSLDEHLNDVHNQADGGDEEEMRELEERKRVEAAKFKAADQNGDEVLDIGELPALFYPETHAAVLHITTLEAMRQKDKNQDGKLSPREFWEVDESDGEDFELSEAEREDFTSLDADQDGFLSLDELKAWESGRFHTEDAMRRMFEIADKDDDLQLTAEELGNAHEEIAASDAQYHLMEWAEHHEL